MSGTTRNITVEEEFASSCNQLSYLAKNYFSQKGHSSFKYPNQQAIVDHLVPVILAALVTAANNGVFIGDEIIKMYRESHGEVQP